VEWQVDETADRLIRQEVIPPLIIVGIDNAQNERIKEFLPYRSFNPPVLRPQGKRYPEFLMNEVMPFVHERYRVARGPENTGLGGSSLGALISLYTVMERPGIFGRVLLESPSLFISNRRIVKYSRLFGRWPEKMFLAIGTREAGRDDKDKQVVEDVRELETNLRRAGLDDNRLLVEIAEGASHNEGEWAKRFPDALSFLFAKADGTSIHVRAFLGRRRLFVDDPRIGREFWRRFVGIKQPHISILEILKQFLVLLFAHIPGPHYL
jgi:enterochelin esterase-like enzyme